VTEVGSMIRASLWNKASIVLSLKYTVRARNIAGSETRGGIWRAVWLEMRNTLWAHVWRSVKRMR